jgi:ABC-type branched-subunit amino acid transport system ATPase component
MLAIGRALVGNPKLLLLDEPLEGLAPILIESLAVALERLRSSAMAMVLVEQQVQFALELADRAIVFDKGQLVLDSRQLGFGEGQRTPRCYDRSAGIHSMTEFPSGVITGDDIRKALFTPAHE